MEKNIDSLISNTIKNLKEILDVNTIIGEAIKVNDDVTIIPICKMTMGLVSGCCDVGKDKFRSAKIDNYAGGSGTGISYTPIGVLSVVVDDVRYIPLGDEIPYFDIVNKVENIVLNAINKEKK
ncbi:MAG: hypothetical protein E7361_04310 [Clostridiales bacterium]|nr:hypothetical protein [Clostridiales bacterium]